MSWIIQTVKVYRNFIVIANCNCQSWIVLLRFCFDLTLCLIKRFESITAINQYVYVHCIYFAFEFGTKYLTLISSYIYNDNINNSYSYCRFDPNQITFHNFLETFVILLLQFSLSLSLSLNKFVFYVKL